ncbi:hypothetical protein [Lentzea sp. NPDC004782]|uniref:hypothetical protein n=1 Tax=Lentzea sp. NPDC004782 TaxID=3154458 RepID=UPI0033B8FA11
MPHPFIPRQTDNDQALQQMPEPPRHLGVIQDNDGRASRWNMTDKDSRAFQALQQTCAQPPRFREESGCDPLVYGYVRSTERRRSYIHACRRVLLGFCASERLRLCGVFIDQGVGPDSVVRPGFTGLCDVLRLPDSFAAVVIDTRHLSLDTQVAALLAQQVRSTGARLVLVRKPRGETASATTPNDCVVPQWWQ